MYINVSKDFKKKSNAAIFSILIFIVVYLLLFVSSILLVLACIYAGIWIVAAKPMLVTIMLGIGLAGMGVCIFIFTIKFLFKKHITHLDNLTEIKRKDAPKLFSMIDEIVKETQTKFPKKIYLTYDVNASVFYDSSFWSMFFPIKKNLIIGMGLINITTKQELKAILAHEFGHFSQKSMKVGSYVYNVNQIIFNLVNDDESYRNSVTSIANMNGYFSFFASISFIITGAIQKILVKIYSYVNLRHMALSREMEFHADEVAANIAGSISLQESLLRLELGENAYNNVLKYYEERFSENKLSKNIYKEQTLIMNFLAQKNNLQYKYNLPFVELSKSMVFNNSKLVISNQWASHPSMEDRIERLEKLNIVKSGDQQLALDLFDNHEIIEEKLTAKIFSQVKYEQQASYETLENFKTEFENQYNENSFSPIFNGYYDNKNPDLTALGNTLEKEASFSELFSQENTEKVFSLLALENDKKTLEAISKKEINIRTFDYDGKKYNTKESLALYKELEIEGEKLKLEIQANDYSIYNYFLKQAEAANKRFIYVDLYTKFVEFDKNYDLDYAFYTELIQSTNFIGQRNSIEQIKASFMNFQTIEEKLKLKIKEFIEDENLQKYFNANDLKDLTYFSKNSHLYFNQDQYLNHNLEQLFKAINAIPFILNKKYFSCKKELLGFMQNLEENRDTKEIC